MTHPKRKSPSGNPFEALSALKEGLPDREAAANSTRRDLAAEPEPEFDEASGLPTTSDQGITTLQGGKVSFSATTGANFGDKDGIDSDDFEGLLAAGVGGEPPKPKAVIEFDERGLFIGSIPEAPTKKLNPNELLYCQPSSDRIFNAREIPIENIRRAAYQYLVEKAGCPGHRQVAIFTSAASESLGDHQHPEYIVGQLIGQLQVNLLIVAAKFNTDWQRYQISLNHSSTKWPSFEVFEKKAFSETEDGSL